MSDLTSDPERFTLRQAAQARDHFAMIMDELDFMKAQIARLPTRRDQAFTPLRIVVTMAFSTAALHAPVMRTSSSRMLAEAIGSVAA
jgi:hypothetical protein